MDRRLLLLYGIVLIDVVVGSAIGPVLPQFVSELTRPQVWLSLGTALFLGVQLVSAPLLGKLSDSLGRRPIIITSTIGTGLANVLLLPVRAGFFFANRLGDGITNGMFATARSSVTDLSAKDDIVKNIGLMSTIISLGNVLGPMVAGLAVAVAARQSGQARVIVLLSVGLSALNVVLSFFFRETADNLTSFDRHECKEELSQSLNVKRLWAKLTESDRARPGLRWLVILTLLFTLAQSYYTYFIAYISTGPLRFNSTQISYFFVFLGSASALTNFIFFKYFVDKIDKKKLVIGMAAIGAGLHVVYANVGQLVWLLYATAVVDSLTLALLGGVLNGLVAQQTSDDDRGDVLGVTQALTGLASLITTLLYGGLSAIDVRLPFYWFALSLAALALLAFRIQGQIQEDPAPDDVRPDAAGPAGIAAPGGTTA